MQEIRRSPVEVGSLSHDLQGFVASQVVVWISEASTVSLEFQDRNSRNDFDSHLQAMEKKTYQLSCLFRTRLMDSCTRQQNLRPSSTFIA